MSATIGGDLNVTRRRQSITRFLIKYVIFNFQTAKMSRVTFSSLTQTARCSRYLKDLSLAAPGDTCSQVVVVTGAGSVSVSRMLLQLLSPLVREAVASLPVLATLQPLNIILLDTDTVTVNTMVELVLSGRTNVVTSGVLLTES